MSGLRFCGIIDELVVYLSAMWRNENSVDMYMIHCSAQRERCMASIAHANRRSHAMSRDAVCSILLVGGVPMSNSCAVTVGSIGSELPAIAPLPRGLS